MRTSSATDFASILRTDLPAVDYLAEAGADHALTPLQAASCTYRITAP